MFTPLEVSIPIDCWPQTLPHREIVTWRYPLPDGAAMRLPPVDDARIRMDEPTMSVHPAATVALATVVAYAAATYGPARIPRLVAAASEHEGWETLLPAVFGVSMDEFETGWQAYLAEQYATVPPPTAD
jgi:hypothetical protein